MSSAYNGQLKSAEVLGYPMTAPFLWSHIDVSFSIMAPPLPWRR